MDSLHHPDGTHRTTPASTGGRDLERHERTLRRHLAGHGEQKWCPYKGCGFGGTDDEVDAHRAENHRDEPQAGSNLSHRPRN